jgi:pimeloyl-ACP methyl ester carboxylesterase
MEGMIAQPLTLYSMDGVRIDAAHLPGADGLCVVLAHGFTGNRRLSAPRRIATALNRVAGVIAIDLRGHGRSGGLSTAGDREILDVDAAVRHARHLGYERVVLVSAPARWYYRDTRPMRRAHWAIERRTGRIAVRLARRTRITPRGWVREPEAPYTVAERISPVPFLVVHGDSDPFLPVEHAEQLYDAAGEPRELWIEPGFGHAEGAMTPVLIGRIGDWVAARSRGNRRTHS